MNTSHIHLPESFPQYTYFDQELLLALFEANLKTFILNCSRYANKSTEITSLVSSHFYDIFMIKKLNNGIEPTLGKKFV